MGADLMEVGAVEWWPLERIVPYARNAKVHGEAQVAQLAGMIKEFGWTYPILVDEEGVILAGHKRLLACERLGLESAPVLVKRGLDKHQKQAYRLADNKLTENSAWDEGLLKIEIGELRDAGVDLGLTAFSDEELKTLWGVEDEPAADPGPQVDRAAELREKWGVESGQMWLMDSGKGHAHRLICGDCTDKATVERVMGGERAALCVTSPPYNQNIDSFSPSGMHKEGDWVAKVRRLSYFDSMPESEYQEWQKEVLAVIYSVVDDNCSVFYNHKNRYREKKVISPLAWIPGPFCLRQEIIWSRPGSVTQNARMFLPSDERIYWMYKGSDFYFDDSTENKTFSTVWDIGLETNKDHAVGFPVELPKRAIMSCSKLGGLVCDPFSGSGTTLIACEQLGRRCRAVEISPAYVSVSLQRFYDMTGAMPVLLEDS